MDKTKLFIYGAGGHGKVVKDVALNNGYKEIIFIDDNSDFDLNKFIKNVKKANIFVAIGDNYIRKQKQEFLEKLGYNIVSLIHSSAVLGSNVTIQKGVVIMPKAVINCNSVIKKGTIINTGAIIEHDNVISAFAHVSSSATTGGGVYIGENTFIGLGAKVINNVQIGANVIVGAGSVVINNIENNTVAVGVPAKKIKDNT